jgi:hypothetical protein
MMSQTILKNQQLNIKNDELKIFFKIYVTPIIYS